MGQSLPHRNHSSSPTNHHKPNESLSQTMVVEEEDPHHEWAERILLVGLRRSGKTLFLQTLYPHTVFDKDLFESVSGKILQHVLKAMIHVNQGNLFELLNDVKMQNDDGEKISMNLTKFVELYVENNSYKAERPISFVELLLDLWKFRIFSDFYYEHLDRFNFNENLELFVEKLRAYRKDGIMFDPFRLISKETLGYKEAVTQVDRFFVTLIENGGNRPDTKLNAKKVIVLTVSLVDCMITVKDESKLLNLGGVNSISNSSGKFDSALSFFQDIAMSRAIKDYFYNTRICILFTKADLLMKRLEKFETFPRFEKDECKIQRTDEISKLRNTFMERNVINYIVNEFDQVLQKAGMKNLQFDYHIINALNQEEVNQSFELIVKPLNQRGVLKHYISPCLYRPLEYLPLSLFSNFTNQYLTDLIINCK